MPYIYAEAQLNTLSAKSCISEYWKKGNIEQKGISWAGLASRCLASQWYSLLFNIHLFSIFTYTWVKLAQFWLLNYTQFFGTRLITTNSKEMLFFKHAVLNMPWSIMKEEFESAWNPYWVDFLGAEIGHLSQ